jgi:uncharacterized membrane-anchored protein
MKNKKIMFLFITILLQITVLIGEYLGSVYPHWTGKEIVLEIRPVDPRSLFRGQYVRLDYTIGQLSGDILKGLNKDIKKLRINEIVYVSLKEQEGVWKADEISLFKPNNKLFICGRVNRNWRSNTLNLKYGIEAYFTSPKRALDLENSVRNNARNKKAFASVMVAPNGKVALKDVIIKDKPLN